MRSSPSNLRFRAAWIIGALIVVYGCSNDFRADVLRCEEAVAHLQECCIGLAVPESVCEYDEGCGDETFPNITEELSECIRSLSCGEIIAGGECTRPSSTGASDASPATRRTCDGR